MRLVNENGVDWTKEIPRVVKWVFYRDGKIVYSHSGWDVDGKANEKEVDTLYHPKESPESVQWVIDKIHNWREAQKF